VVTLLTKLQPRDAESAHQVAGKLATLARAVPAEPGNIDYNAFAVEGQPDVYYIIESWTSHADAERHATRVVQDGLIDEVADLITEAPDTITLQHI
jgi:quinol monooxygenase YgiN